MEPQTESIETLVDSVITLNDGESPMNLRQAANALADYRYKRDADEAAAPPEAAAPAASREAEKPVTSQEEPAAPPQEATGAEQTPAIDPAPEEPPLDLPRSWARDRAESWARLDRETQQMLLDHDSKASTEIRRTQNEAAEQRKALDAERTQLEQARKQYEDALPQLMSVLQEQQQGQFSDIKTMADVERMAREDWPRYALWDAHQKRVASVQAEWQATQQRQQEEYQTQFRSFVDTETKKFLNIASDLKTSEQQNKFAGEVVSLYKDIGYTDDEIGKLIRGEASVNPNDHRQLLLARDALRYRQAKAAVPKAIQKPVPNVQRPGSPTLRAADVDVEITNRENQLNKSGNWKDAAELLIARRGARR